MTDQGERSFRVVGGRHPRVDGYEKATGRTRYVADLKIPGCLHGKVLRSPYPHARILHIDPSAAERLPGVRAVVTHRDTPGVLYGAYSSGVKDELILAGERVRYVGDEVAAVAAIDPDIAEEALSLIRVDYEPLPFHPDCEAAMAEGAEPIHPVERNTATHRVVVRGDPESGFREADLVLEDTFRTGLQMHAYLEPVACLAEHDRRGRFHLQAPLQNPSWCRFIFAEALDLPISRFHVVQTPIGGAFGGKLEHKLYLVAFLLARKAGFAVRLENSRDEDFQVSMPRVPMRIQLKMGMRRDGRITAKTQSIVADNGAYSKYAPAVVNLGTYRIDGLYRIMNVRNETRLVYTNKPPTSAFRGFGNPQITFAVESLLDMLAREMGLDPLEVRLKNAARPGDTTVHGFKLISCGLVDSFEQVGQCLEYRGERPTLGKDEGIGLSGTSHVCGNRGFFPLFDGATTVIRVDEGGNVRVVVGETDVGQGLLTAFAMITAEELGVSLERVQVDACDTDLCAFGLGTWGDRATFIGGNAVKKAAAEARKAIIQVASEMMEANPEDLVIREDQVYVRGTPHLGRSFEEIAAHAVYSRGGAPIVVQGTFVPESEKADSLFLREHLGHLRLRRSGLQGAGRHRDRRSGGAGVPRGPRCGPRPEPDGLRRAGRRVDCPGYRLRAAGGSAVQGWGDAQPGVPALPDSDGAGHAGGPEHAGGAHRPGRAFRRQGRRGTGHDPHCRLYRQRHPRCRRDPDQGTAHHTGETSEGAARKGKGKMRKEILLQVNGEPRNVEVAAATTLLDVLRGQLDLTGAKRGCDHGECGACTVLLDGRPIRACLMLAFMAEGHQITTIEGLERGPGQLDPVQEAFLQHGAIQCGFCTPGMILTAKSLLEENPDPADREVRAAISGNLCRCTGYVKIVEAVRAVGKERESGA